MNRQEHLDWAKKRALEYCSQGDMIGACSSMIADLSKHQETANHIGIQLMMQMLMGGFLSSPQEMRRFIEGFN